jgi:UDP-N-acetylglucosamine 4,6-dehydratase/5-epimerase
VNFQGQTILVTGGAGSFGRAFASYALTHGAARVIVYSRDEEKHRQLRKVIPDRRLAFCIGDVRDRDHLRLALSGVDVLIHASAMKQVPACEADPVAATITNVIGTVNVVEMARLAEVPKVILLSTDKAPDACTVYGKTKSLAESIIIRANGHRTRYSITRYGNVVASTGSVVQTFLEQRQTGVLTVTDCSATRFWMCLQEAVELVTWTIAHMVGGEIVVPKIHSSRVVDVATAIGPHCTVKEIGLRPGEKRHEILLAPDEIARTYDCSAAYVIAPMNPDWPFVLPAAAVPVGEGFRYGSDDHPSDVRFVQHGLEFVEVSA